MSPRTTNLIAGGPELFWGEACSMLAIGCAPLSEWHSRQTSSALKTISGTEATWNPHDAIEAVNRVRHAGRAAPGEWLNEALQDLHAICDGHEVDGPLPTTTASAEASDLLKHLSSLVADAPSVVDDPAQAIGIEFFSVPGSRLLFVIERDGQASYYDLIESVAGRARYPDWRSMMDAVGQRGLERSGLRLIG